MIVRVTAYDTSSLDAARDWIRERVNQLRNLDGVERFDVVSQEDPDRAGAVIYFESREAYERYREQRLPELQDSILGSSWGEGHAFEHVFELEEI